MMRLRKEELEEEKRNLERDRAQYKQELVQQASQMCQVSFSMLIAHAVDIAFPMHCAGSRRPAGHVDCGHGASIRAAGPRAAGPHSPDQHIFIVDTLCHVCCVDLLLL